MFLASAGGGGGGVSGRGQPAVGSVFLTKLGGRWKLRQGQWLRRDGGAGVGAKVAAGAGRTRERRHSDGLVDGGIIFCNDVAELPGACGLFATPEKPGAAGVLGDGG